MLTTPDPNHKPEMAIALTPFLAFLNFLPLPTLLLHLLTVPELDDIIPPALRSKLASSLTLPDTQPADPLFFTATTAAPTEEQKAILKDIFEALMTAEESKVKTAIASLVDRYTNGEVAESEKGLVDLVKMLDEQYPGDVGVLCVFILNVVELKKGEAAFLGASMPHAYISGGESSLGGLGAELCRYHRVHGHVGQCGQSGIDPETPGRGHARQHAHVRGVPGIETALETESIRRLCLFVTLRPAHCRV